MSLSCEHGAQTILEPADTDEHDFCTRIEAEFLEMPGLILTLPQAARLFGIEPARCERLLGALVQAGRLASNGKMFAHPRSGRLSA